MRVAIVPNVDAASEHDAAGGLATHVRDEDLRQRLSVVPEKLTAAEALGVPVRRLGAPRIPVGYAPPLEDEARITPERIVAALAAFRA